MNDRTKLEKLNAELKKLIDDYRHMLSDDDRKIVREQIENVKNSIKCIENMY